MQTKHQSIAVIAGTMVLFSASCSFAQDWPQWRGLHRDGQASGFTAPEKWPGTLTQKWKVTVGSGDATPALVGGKLYVFARQGEDEVTLCLQADDGKEVWQNKYAAQAVAGPAARHPGPRSSPTVADGKVITLGVGGILSCLDAATGKELWRKDELAKVVPQFFTAMSPIVADGLCIAHLGAKDKGAVFAYELASGNEKWKWTGEGPAYGSPVVLTLDGSKQVILQTEKSLLSLDVANGKQLWQIPAAAQGRVYNSATPLIDRQTVIYTGQGRGTKAIKVEKTDFGCATKELWSNDQLGTGFNSPVLQDGYLYGHSDRGNFFCLNAKTGQTAWTDATKRANFCSIVDAGTVIIALPENAELIVFKADSKQYEELAKIKVSDNQTYAHPVIVGKQIFIKDKDALTLWTLN